MRTGNRQSRLCCGISALSRAAYSRLFEAMLIAASVLPTQVAASGWAEPAEGVLEDISTGLVSMSSRVIAIGIVIIGGWAAGSGYIDKKKMVGVVAGAILIFYGPQAIELLVGAA